MSSGPSCWLFSVTFENWKKLQEGRLWAVRREIAKKVRVNDFVVLYVKGTGSICGALQILGDWYEVKEPFWPDEIAEGRVRYPYQVQVKFVQEGVADIRKMMPKLSFIENRKKWGVYFQGTPANLKRPIPEPDYAVIVEEMKVNPLPPTLERLLEKKAKPSVKDTEVIMVERGLPPFRLDSFVILTEYIRNIDKIARRDSSLIIDNLQNRFEDVVYGVFKMMQLSVEQRGYKRSGEEQPDGLIVVERYLLVPYDCKTAEDPFSLSINERRAIEAHTEKLFKEFREIEFRRMVHLIVSHSFDSPAIRHAEDLSETLEDRFGKPVKIALVTTKALTKLLEKTIAEGPKPDVFRRLKGLVDDWKIEELWKVM